MTNLFVQYGDHRRTGSKERCDQYTYEQFVNSEFEHLEFLGRRLGGPTGRKKLGIDPDKALYSACLRSNCTKASKRTVG